MAETGRFAVQVQLDDNASGQLPGPVALVAVSGEIDLVTVPELRRTLTEVIDAPTHEVVVDLSEVEFMDASGLGALIGAAGEAAQAGVRFRLRAPSPSVERILTLTHVDGSLEVDRQGAHP